MIFALVLFPLSAGLISFLIRNDYARRFLFLITAVGHLILCVCAWRVYPVFVLNGWFGLDSLGMIFLNLTSVLFSGAAVYGIYYLGQEKKNTKNSVKSKSRGVFCNTPESIFTGCILLFLAAMTTVILSQHFGMLWVAIEATTLVSAPLIYFHRSRNSLEATWKYLLICSVGIALALMGNLLLAVAGLKNESLFVLKDLIEKAPLFDAAWLKASFVFLFAGYGTKMGLAPFHTWLPDAHSESPSVVSALLSGALLNCAFLGILRAYQVCVEAGLQSFCAEILTLFGLLSMVFAACFILGQTDYKRMLAYSSIEHMGILALSVGLGGGAIFGGLLHAVNHSLTKAGLFFVAGNILSLYGTKNICEVKGIIKAARRTGILWLVGFFLITGTPPAGIFLSKFIILKAAVEQKHYWIALVYLISLAVIFIGMAKIFIPMAQGAASKNTGIKEKKHFNFMLMPAVIFFGLVMLMGIYLAPGLSRLLSEAAKILGGH